MTDFVNSGAWKFEPSTSRLVEITYERRWRKWWHAMLPFRWFIAPAFYVVDYGFVNTRSLTASGLEAP